MVSSNIKPMACQRGEPEFPGSLRAPVQYQQLDRQLLSDEAFLYLTPDRRESPPLCAVGTIRRRPEF